MTRVAYSEGPLSGSAPRRCCSRATGRKWIDARVALGIAPGASRARRGMVEILSRGPCRTNADSRKSTLLLRVVGTRAGRGLTPGTTPITEPSVPTGQHVEPFRPCTTRITRASHRGVEAIPGAPKSSADHNSLSVAALPTDVPGGPTWASRSPRFAETLWSEHVRS